jgi:hypothetical protein
MDRDRLKEVHTTDLTESRVNEDFVDWLKTKGPTWLLIILIALCVFVATVRWRQHKDTAGYQAWGEFYAAQGDLPSRLETVADTYGEIDQLANVARLEAANKLLSTIQSGRELAAAVPIPDDPANTGQVPETPETAPLTPEAREKNLTRAEGLFNQVIASDDGSAALTLHIVSAMNGMAAIAESRADASAAVQWYGKAADRAGTFYPGLAEQARVRAETVETNVASAVFPEEADRQRSTGPTSKISPVGVDAAIRDLVMPDE